MNKFFILLGITLSACTEPSKQASVKQIESSADTGGALAVYRHMDKMEELAREMRMIHPVEMRKKK